ncbi:MAG TPA: PhoH family protein, partial [Candidatus Deferrimicrobiaceae bacterium]
MTEAREDTIRFEDPTVLPTLFGPHDAHLKALEKALGVVIRPGSGDARVAGDPIPVELAGKVLSGLYRVLRRGIPVAGNDVDAAIRIVSADRNADVSEVFQDVVFKSSRNRMITPKSVAQKRYLDAMRDFDIVFGVGPAGTGKTFLAMAMAVGFLLRKEVKRIVLARPAVEAGEKLGFLPGDMAEKVNPYLR